jgi:hypothetical protein
VKICIENICKFSGLRDEFPAQQNRELIRDIRESISAYQAGTGKWAQIDLLPAMKPLYRAVVSSAGRSSGGAIGAATDSARALAFTIVAHQD